MDTNQAEERTAERRGFLRSVGTTSIGGGLATLLAERDLAGAVAAQTASADQEIQIDDGADPAGTFPQSVASGGPTESGVILWTRIDPTAYAQDESIAVQVATDADFSTVVQAGRLDASDVWPARDYTVTADLDGELSPDSEYYYRFVYDGVASQTGRCRTLPAPDASPDSVSLAVLSCQDYQNGYFNAFRHVTDEDVDFVLHLGDFIYEAANGEFTGSDGIAAGRDITLPSGADLAESLADFRHLYRTYRGDDQLRAAQERHTFIYGWDDHEIAENRYWDSVTEAPVLPLKADGDDPQFAVDVTAGGIQAWIEHVPARVEYDPSASSLHDQLRLYRRYEFGDLVDLAVTDERLFRDGPPCEQATLTCGTEDDESRTMLGETQKRWWKYWIANSTATWTTWANEVLSMALTVGSGTDQVEILHDSWDGFQHERHELLDFVADADLQNFVTLTGDMHATMVGYQMTGYGEIEPDAERTVVGTEFMTPAISSVNAGDYLEVPQAWEDEPLSAVATAENDHIAYADFYAHGYGVVEFTPEAAEFTAYAVDAKIDAADVPKERLVSYRTSTGNPQLSRR